MRTHLAQNQFITNSTPVAPRVETATASLTLPASGAVANLSDGDIGAPHNSGEREPSAMLAYPPSEAATVSGREPVAATLISDGQDVPAQMQGSNDCGLARDDVKPGDTMQESRPAHPATAPSGLSHNAITQAVEIQSSCGAVEAVERRIDQASVVGVQFPLIDRTQMEVASIPQDHIQDLEQLIGVAGKRRRRPLALPPFAPDFPALWKAMHDKTAPRTVLDPLWADEPPLFLKG